MEFPLAYGLDKVGLPLICTTDNLIFLVDTGASNSVLFTYVYEHLKERFTDVSGGFKIMGMEGNYVDAPRVEGVINILDKDYKVKFTVYDGTKAFGNVQEKTGIQIHGILGIDFIVTYRWILDFERFVVIENEEKENADSEAWISLKL